MTYDLIYSESALKTLKKLDKNLSKRIISTLERMRIRPHAYVLRLVASPYYRMRVGDYRVILDIRDEKLIVFVIEVGHRKNIYKIV